MASIKDVAKHADVSIATVSRYFNEPERIRPKTRASIEGAIKALGYTPNHLARNFRMGNTRIILVMTQSVGDTTTGDMIGGMTEVASKAGYLVRIQQTEASDIQGDFIELIRSRQADGIVVVGHAGDLGKRTREVPSNGLPIVVCGETSDMALDPFPRFETDGRTAMCEMVNYLIRLGHRRIAFLQASTPLLTMRARELGYRDALQGAGIAIDEEIVKDAHYQATEARYVTSDLMALSEPPTAIACATDKMALGVMAELNALGIRVPEDISVTGYDDMQFAALSNPPLTTVAQAASEIGERAMRCLLRLIDGKPVKGGVEHLAHQLVIRKTASVAPR